MAAASFDFGISCSYGFGFCDSFFDDRTPATYPVLSRVRQFVEPGWPLQALSRLDIYSLRKDELSVQHGVLF